MNSLSWNFDEFLAFLLIYASHADLEFSDDEKIQIKEIVSDKVFEDLYAQFNELTDYQVLELIMSYKDLYFSTEEDKELLIVEMKRIFNADGDFSIWEKDFLVFLEKLL